MDDQRAYPADRDEVVAWFHPGVPMAPGEARVQNLSVDVFERLAGHANAGQPNEARVKWYDTRGEADAAMARAADPDAPHVVTG